MQTQVRAVTIGGSEAAAALGLSRHKSKLRLYLEKIGEVEKEEAGEAAYWGNVLEEIVAKEFERRTGKKVRRANQTLVHPQYPFMVGHIDRKIVGEDAILECKTTSSFFKDEWEGDNIPQEYIIQVQHYLAITGYERAYIAVLIGGQRFAWKEISRDEELIGLIIEGEKKFVWHVENRIPPEIDGSEDTEKILNLLYPSAKVGTVIELPAYVDLVEEIQALNSQIKQLEEVKAEKENKLKELMGENEKAVVGEYIVVWKNINSKRFDTAAFKEAHPELYERFLKETSYRQFKIQKQK